MFSLPAVLFCNVLLDFLFVFFKFGAILLTEKYGYDRIYTIKFNVRGA